MKSFPFDSQVTYDGQGNPSYDRGVNSQDLAENIALMFTNGVAVNPSTCFQVMASENSMSVEVAPGACCIEGRLGKEESVRTIVFEAAETASDRIDRVVLRLNTNVDYRSIDLYVVKGTPAAQPEPPALTRTAGIYELGIANVFIARNTTYISESRITDTRLDDESCGLMVTKPTEIDVTSIFNQYQGALDEYLDFANSCISETVVGELEESFAPLYDTTEEYNEGDLCSHNGKFYECQEDETTGEWDPDCWKRTSVKAQNDRINNDFSAQIDALISSLTDRLFPVGYVYTSTSSVNPGTYLGGTWVRIAKGRAIVGVDENDSDFNEPKKTSGSKTVTLDVTQIPSHRHSIPVLNGLAYEQSLTGSFWLGGVPKIMNASGIFSGGDGGNQQSVNVSALGGATQYGSISINASHSHSVTTNASNTGNTGGNASSVTQPIINVQPSFAIYLWERTA